MVSLISGDVFFIINNWPKWMELLFWKKPFSDNDTFKGICNFIGNGCPPLIISKWILTSIQLNPGKDQLHKRLRQITWILSNWKKNERTWFYFDKVHKRYFYLDGTDRIC